MCVSSTERALSFLTDRAGTHLHASQTYIASLIDDLKTALFALDAHPPMKLLEEWATLIHGCLSVESRNFHSVYHAFEISAGCDPLQILAAFFRDSIKCVTDGALTARQETFVANVIVLQQHQRQRQLQHQSYCQNLSSRQTPMDLANRRLTNLYDGYLWKKNRSID